MRIWGRRAIKNVPSLQVASPRFYEGSFIVISYKTFKHALTCTAKLMADQ